MMFCLAVMTHAVEGAEERVAAGYAALEAASRTEEAVLEWRVHRSLEDPRRFFLYEAYRDEAGLDAHRATDHFRRYQQDILPLLDERVATRWAPLSGG